MTETPKNIEPAASYDKQKINAQQIAQLTSELRSVRKGQNTTKKQAGADAEKLAAKSTNTQEEIRQEEEKLKQITISLEAKKKEQNENVAINESSQKKNANGLGENARASSRVGSEADNFANQISREDPDNAAKARTIAAGARENQDKALSNSNIIKGWVQEVVSRNTAANGQIDRAIDDGQRAQQNAIAGADAVTRTAGAAQKTRWSLS